MYLNGFEALRSKWHNIQSRLQFVSTRFGGGQSLGGLSLVVQAKPEHPHPSERARGLLTMLGQPVVGTTRLFGFLEPPGGMTYGIALLRVGGAGKPCADKIMATRLFKRDAAPLTALGQPALRCV